MTLEARITEQVRQLLARGCGQRQTARLMSGQVSKSQVGKIAREKKPLAPPPNEQIQGNPGTPIVGKCPGCHYTVELPCKICRARDYRHRHLQYKRERRRRRKENRS
jgi:hypothetical protein